MKRYVKFATIFMVAIGALMPGLAFADTVCKAESDSGNIIMCGPSEDFVTGMPVLDPNRERFTAPAQCHDSDSCRILGKQFDKAEKDWTTRVKAQAKAAAKAAKKK